MPLLLVSTVFLYLLEILEQQALNNSMPGITERVGGAFLFGLFMFCWGFWGFFWKQAERMSCYLELALCQAAVSEPQAAWGLTLGESKSCAFTQINEYECCCSALWFPRGEKRNKNEQVALVWIAPQLQWG